MVVEVLVAQRQGQDALPDQVADLVIDPGPVPMVGEAGGEAVQEADPPVDLGQEQSAGVGGDVPAVETGTTSRRPGGRKRISV